MGCDLIPQATPKPLASSLAFSAHLPSRRLRPRPGYWDHHDLRVENPKVEIMSRLARSFLELRIEGGNAASKCGLHLTADIVCNYFEEILLDTVDGDLGDIRGV